MYSIEYVVEKLSSARDWEGRYIEAFFLSRWHSDEAERERKTFVGALDVEGVATAWLLGDSRISSLLSSQVLSLAPGAGGWKTLDIMSTNGWHPCEHPLDEDKVPLFAPNVGEKERLLHQMEVVREH